MDAITTGDLINLAVIVGSAGLTLFGSLRIVETRLAHARELHEAVRLQAIDLQRQINHMQREFVSARHFDQVVQELKEERKDVTARLDRLLELALQGKLTV